MLKIKSQYLFYCGIFKFPDSIFVVSSEILSQLTRSVPMQVVSERENLLFFLGELSLLPEALTTCCPITVCSTQRQ